MSWFTPRWLDPEIVGNIYIYTFPESAAAVYNFALSREHTDTYWCIEEMSIKCNGMLVSDTSPIREHHIVGDDILIIPPFTYVNPTETAPPILSDITMTLEIKFAVKPAYTIRLGVQITVLDWNKCKERKK